MELSRTTPPRVVLLTHAPRPIGGLLAAHDRAFELVCVSTAYEVAAELLSGQVDVLAVDLRLLKADHAGLLDIARSRGVELLGAGPLPWGVSSEHLAGMKLLARAELADAILAAVGPGRAAAPAGTKEAQPIGQVGTYEKQPVTEEPLLTPEELAALLGDGEKAE